MDESKVKIRKFSGLIKGILIFLQVLAILGLVVGCIILFVPMFQPDKIDPLESNYGESSFFLVTVLGTIFEDMPSRYRMMIAGFAFAIAMALVLFYIVRTKKVVSDVIQSDTPFTRKVTDQIGQLSKSVLVLIIYSIPFAAMSFLLLRLLYYIFDYATYLQDRADETSRIQEEMILSFAEITENKSEQTGKHVRRVAEYSRIIAKEMGLDKTEADRIRLASTMHDVGKLLIPAEILEKPARLTDEEFAVIRKHPGYGGDMLKNVEGDVMHMARTVALEHHERPDGKGYPEGKKADEISLEGRIVAVADVYDALTSKRSYKEAWDEERAYEEILKGKGTQFDPEVVDAFTRAHDKINEVRLQLQDA